MREAQTEPHVFVNLQRKEELISFLDLVIQNIGLGAAYNIKFEVTPDIMLRTGRFLSDLNLIKNGIKYLPPNQRISFYIGNLIKEAKKPEKTILKISVEYENRNGKNFNESFILDFTEFLGLLHIGESSLKKIANNIEKIQQNLHLVSLGSKKLNVITHTKKNKQ